MNVQPSEDLYDQKPAETPPELAAPAPASGTTVQSAPKSSRFLYMDDVPSSNGSDKESSSSSHIAAPSTTTDFFSEFGEAPIKSSFNSGRSKAQASYSFFTRLSLLL